MSSPLFTGTALPLTAQGFESAVDYLGALSTEVWAVLQVETRGCGFFADRRPVVLFERHVFSRRTRGVFDATHPEVSHPEPGGYAGGVAEYARLEQAVALDARAALLSTSWGLGQVMGFHYSDLLYITPPRFVASMMASEDAQLRAMVGVIWWDKGEHQLYDALRRHDWATFARSYNGPDYRKNQYDEKLEAAHQHLLAHGLPDLSVREGQVLLTFLGFEPGTVDGAFGPRTQAALARFQEQAQLPPTGRFDAPTLAALRERHARLPRNEAVPGQEVARD